MVSTKLKKRLFLTFSFDLKQSRLGRCGSTRLHVSSWRPATGWCAYSTMFQATKWHSTTWSRSCVNPATRLSVSAFSNSWTRLRLWSIASIDQMLWRVLSLGPERIQLDLAMQFYRSIDLFDDWVLSSAPKDCTTFNWTLLLKVRSGDQ